MNAQLDLLDCVLADQAPWALDDRDRILAAMIADDVLHGHVDPNCVRRHLTSATGELQVNPRRLAASYHGKHLRRVGEVRSDDAKGRNVGAVVGLYRWVGAA